METLWQTSARSSRSKEVLFHNSYLVNWHYVVRTLPEQTPLFFLHFLWWTAMHISRNKIKGGKSRKLVSNPASSSVAQTWPTINFPPRFPTFCSWSTSDALWGIGYFTSSLYCPACPAGQGHDVGWSLVFYKFRTCRRALLCDSTTGQLDRGWSCCFRS